MRAETKETTRVVQEPLMDPFAKIYIVVDLDSKREKQKERNGKLWTFIIKTVC